MSLFFNGPSLDGLSDGASDFLLQRLAATKEGSPLSPANRGEFSVPFVSGLRIIQTVNNISSTTFTLTWQDIESDANIVVDHYNIYYTLLGTNTQQPVGPFTAAKSPAQITVPANTNITVTFKVQTILTNGVASSLDNCAAVSGQTGIVAVRADHVLRGNTDNIVEDPSFERNLGSWFSLGSQFEPLPRPPSTDPNWAMILDDAANSHGGTGYARYIGSGGSSRLFNVSLIEAKTNDQFYGEVYVKVSSGATGDVLLKFLWYDAAGAFIGGDSGTITPTTSYQRIITNAIVSGAAAYMLVHVECDGFTGTAYFDDVYVRRVITSEILRIPNVLIGPHGSLGISGVTWSNNSPGAGKVAWSAGTLTYRGVVYAVPAGDTGASGIWIYWELGSPNVIQSSSSYPSLGIDDFLIGLNNSFGAGGSLGYFSQALEVHDAQNVRTYIIPGAMFSYNSSSFPSLSLARSAADPPGAGVLRLFDGTSTSATIIGAGSTGKIQLTDLQIASGGKIIYNQAPGPGKSDAGASVPIVVNGTTYYIELFN